MPQNNIVMTETASWRSLEEESVASTIIMPYMLTEGMMEENRVIYKERQELHTHEAITVTRIVTEKVKYWLHCCLHSVNKIYNQDDGTILYT